MNLNGNLILPIDKVRTSSKKDLLNNNKTKFINLILSKKSISFLSNLKYNNKNLIHKINISNKGLSLKNSCLQKSKISLANNLYNIKKIKVKDFSNYKNVKNRNKIKKVVDTSCHNLKKRLQNKSFSTKNKSSYDIPNGNISYTKKKKYEIKNKKSESIRKMKYKKSKSISLSRNLNMCGYSFEERKISNINLPNNKINFSINWSIRTSKNKNYLKNSQDLKNKINKFIKEQKIKKNKTNILLLKSQKRLISSEKINTNGNITTNNSDKENTDFTTKKNNLTTHSNNIPYCITNFNNSTNITETNNIELISENRYIKQKKIIKKKLGLPFHPNSKKLEYYNQIGEKNKFLIRNNKSEINIPYNRKINKNYKIKRDNSPFNNHQIKFGKVNIHHSARNKKNKNDSFFYLYSNNNNDNNNNNFIDSFDYSFNEKNNNYSIKNNNLYLFRKENEAKEELIGVEDAHFRIVAMIQENKQLINCEDK